MKKGNQTQGITSQEYSIIYVSHYFNIPFLYRFAGIYAVLMYWMPLS